MKARRNFYFVAWAISILAMAPASHAQIIPGQWHRAALPQPARAGNDNTQDFSFIDSLNGICVSDYGLISSTSDGGRTWILDTNIYNDYLDRKGNLNSVECTAPHRGFFHGGNCTISIAPSETTVRFPPEAGQINYGDYTTLAEKMYDTAYGFRLIEAFSSVLMIVTRDGWQSSVPYDSGYLQNAQSPAIAYIVDSNDVWTEEGNNLVWTGTGFVDSPKVILHTINGGLTWQSYDAFDSGQYHPWVQDLFVNPKNREVFCMVNYSHIDYAYSSDYGTTWQLDSTFSGSSDYEKTWRASPIEGVLWRMANPTPGILWAMIGGSGYANVEVRPPADAIGADSNNYSRKIGYSSDNGAHWLIDSTTFLDDSMEEMHWLDARHGWIASWSHDSLWMWYYDADGNSGVVKHSSPELNQFIVYPNPAQSSITVNGATPDMVISDALGRTWACPHNGNQFNVAELPPGIYFVSKGSQRIRFVKE